MLFALIVLSYKRVVQTLLHPELYRIKGCLSIKFKLKFSPLNQVET